MGKAENENDSSKLLDLHWIESDRIDKSLFETESDGFKRKLLRNPFVPLGIFFTVMILARGLREHYRGNFLQSQRMMRFRVGMQGLTIFFAVAGLAYEAKKKKGETEHS